MASWKTTVAVAVLALPVLSLPVPTWGQGPPATIAQPGMIPPDRTPSRPTLIPEAGDPANVDEVVLPAKPVLLLSGSGDWDSGFKTLQDAVGRIEKELARLNIAPAGRPLVLYTETTDDSFKFDAMVPVSAAPEPAPTDLAPGMRFATTPSGKAWRFVHKGAYDDVDTTYETITTYLEAKDIVARDAFLEEFATDAKDGADATLELNIFVQPK